MKWEPYKEMKIQRSGKTSVLIYWVKQRVLIVETQLKWRDQGKIRVILTKSVRTEFSWPWLSFLVIWMFLLSQHREGSSYIGVLTFAFRNEKGNQILLSPMILTQDNQYAKVVYFGVTCPKIFSLFSLCMYGDTFLSFFFFFFFHVIF